MHVKVASWAMMLLSIYRAEMPACAGLHHPVNGVRRRTPGAPRGGLPGALGAAAGQHERCRVRPAGVPRLLPLSIWNLPAQDARNRRGWLTQAISEYKKRVLRQGLDCIHFMRAVALVHYLGMSYLKCIGGPERQRV